AALVRRSYPGTSTPNSGARQRPHVRTGRADSFFASRWQVFRVEASAVRRVVSTTTLRDGEPLATESDLSGPRGVGQVPLPQVDRRAGGVGPHVRLGDQARQPYADAREGQIGPPHTVSCRHVEAPGEHSPMVDTATVPRPPRWGRWNLSISTLCAAW